MRSGPPSWTRCKLDGPLPNTAHFKSAEKYGFPLCDGSLARGLFIESRPSDADGRGTDGDVRLPRPGGGRAGGTRMPGIHTKKRRREFSTL